MLLKIGKIMDKIVNAVAAISYVGLVAIVLLSKYAVRLYKDYMTQKKQGVKDPVFKKESMPDIQNDLECW